MSLEDIANQLVMLSQLADRHGAPVALRAIQDMLKIRKILDEKDDEATPLFVLPAKSKIDHKVKDPED